MKRVDFEVRAACSKRKGPNLDVLVVNQLLTGVLKEVLPSAVVKRNVLCNPSYLF